MWTCSVTHVIQNIFFCVQHKKEMNIGLGQHVIMTNLNVNYPFNYSRLHVQYCPFKSCTHLI